VDAASACTPARPKKQQLFQRIFRAQSTSRSHRLPALLRGVYLLGATSKRGVTPRHATIFNIADSICSCSVFSFEQQQPLNREIATWLTSAKSLRGHMSAVWTQAQPRSRLFRSRSINQLNCKRLSTFYSIGNTLRIYQQRNLAFSKNMKLTAAI